MNGTHPLDRPVWNMLGGRQASLCQSYGSALRIDPGYGPFAAASGLDDAAQADLAQLVQASPGEVWLVEAEACPAPGGTRIIRTAPLVQMVAESPAPMDPHDADAVPLEAVDAPAMAELALATEPGPWGNKTHLYGQFYGIRDAARLRAMAGSRMRPATGYAEVSGVCTWPEWRGHGYAASLIRRVMADFVERGDVPFLHSYAGNAKAIGLYESLGFRIRRTMTVTVLAGQEP